MKLIFEFFVQPGDLELFFKLLPYSVQRASWICAIKIQAYCDTIVLPYCIAASAGAFLTSNKLFWRYNVAFFLFP